MGRELDSWLARVDDAYPDEDRLRGVAAAAQERLSADDASVVAGRAQGYLGDLALARGEDPTAEDD